MNIKISKIIAGFILAALFWSVSAGAERIVIEAVGFATPESVEYYAAEDVYLVTNINGSPLEADGNGFISKLSPDGKVINLKWIDGTKKGIRLNAPKGAAIDGNILYVADLDEVQLFELPGGRQITSVKIEGSTFLNGITPGEDNNVYVTDSGLMGGEGGFVPSGSDAVYEVTAAGKYKTIVKDKNMGRPNGIIRQGDKFTVVTFGSGKVYSLDKMGKRSSMPTPPKGALDGLLRMDDGSYLISSWNGSAIYRLGKDGVYTTLADSLKGPADIGYDSKRKRVLVPLFTQNKVVILPL
ncbi:MAG: hypothetical protein ACC663_07895 [Gammaproteobacteria bacterium]